MSEEFKLSFITALGFLLAYLLVNLLLGCTTTEYRDQYGNVAPEHFVRECELEAMKAYPTTTSSFLWITDRMNFKDKCLALKGYKL